MQYSSVSKLKIRHNWTLKLSRPTQIKSDCLELKTSFLDTIGLFCICLYPSWKSDTVDWPFKSHIEISSNETRLNSNCIRRSHTCIHYTWLEVSQKKISLLVTQANNLLITQLYLKKKAKNIQTQLGSPTRTNPCYTTVLCREFSLHGKNRAL